MFDRARSIITIKDYLTKEIARLKQVVKENGYQESNLSQSKQQTQATDIQGDRIKMSINLAYAEGIREKLRRMLRCHKIRFTFYTENILRKLLPKPKDRAATEDKNRTPVNLNGL